MVGRALLICMTCMALGACQPRDRSPALSELDAPEPITNFTVGAWVNRYAGRSDLAGVVVQQFPDCPHEAANYEGRHPAMILYVFDDGRVNQNGFTPEGAVEEDFWWKAEPHHPLWERMDRTIIEEPGDPE